MAKHADKHNVEAPEIDIWSYSIEGVSPAFDPNRALLRRVFFLDENNPLCLGGFLPINELHAYGGIWGIEDRTY